MRYYIDCEFIDDAKTIDLISIAIVAEDGREYYAQSVEFDPAKTSPWVQENVLTHLSLCPLSPVANEFPNRAGLIKFQIYRHQHSQCTGLFGNRYQGCPWRTRVDIQSEIISFLDPEKYGKPELIGWCSAYDFVVLCQLFGTMMDLPANYPHYIKDIQFLLDEQGLSDDQLPPMDGPAHDALADARYIGYLWRFLHEREQSNA